jgi:hypothetical protein
MSLFDLDYLKKPIIKHFRIVLLPPRPKNEVPTQAKETPSEYRAPFIVDCLLTCLLGLGNETF